MDRTSLEAWLRAYGRAWENRDAGAFAALFAPDARYYWTPFEEPKLGQAGVAQAFENAVARQTDIRFEATVLKVEGAQGIAHWKCTFQRLGNDSTVRLDGVFVMQFDEHGLCTIFREWWHRDETM